MSSRPSTTGLAGGVAAATLGLAGAFPVGAPAAGVGGTTGTAGGVDRGGVALPMGVDGNEDAVVLPVAVLLVAVLSDGLSAFGAEASAC
jgi:hypothetical protein